LFCRNEIEGKQYMDQLMTRQNASLASENSSSGLIEEVKKYIHLINQLFMKWSSTKSMAFGK